MEKAENDGRRSVYGQPHEAGSSASRQACARRTGHVMSKVYRLRRQLVQHILAPTRVFVAFQSVYCKTCLFCILGNDFDRNSRGSNLLMGSHGPLGGHVTVFSLTNESGFRGSRVEKSRNLLLGTCLK